MVHQTFINNIDIRGTLSVTGSSVEIPKYDSALTTINANSANWDSAYNSISETSTNWDSTYTTVQDNSANWDNSLSNNYVHENFLPLSGGTVTGTLDIGNDTNITLFVTDDKVGINTEVPNEALTVIGNISASGNIVTNGQILSGGVNISSLFNIGATGTGVDLGVRALTGNWQDTYTNVSTNSAENATREFVDTNYVSLTGGTITGDLAVLSSFEVGSTEATTLYVNDGFVGIKTELPNTELTVNGSISSNQVIYDELGNSLEWNSSHTTVQSNSSSWTSQTISFDSLNNELSISNGNTVSLSSLATESNNSPLTGLILNTLDTYQIGFAGDSIAQAYGTIDFSASPFAWYCFYANPKAKRISWNPALAYTNVSPFTALNPAGGYVFARGGETTQDLARQLPLIQQKTPELLVVQIGTNNGFGSLADSNTRFAEVTSFLTGVVDAGVRHSFVFPVPPKGITNSATVVRLTNEYNKRLENYCKADPQKLTFFDNYEFLVDPTNEFYRPFGVYDGSTENSVTTDGTHPSTFGSFRVSNKVEDTLLNDLPVMRFKAMNPGDAWDGTNNIRGNLLGRNGIMFSEAGSTGLSTGWTLTNGTGISAIPTRVASEAYNGYTMQKLAISGTPTSNTDQIRLSYSGFNTSFFNRGLTGHNFELVFRPISFSKLHLPRVDIQILGGSHGTDIFTIGGGGGSGGMPAKLCPVQDGYFHTYSTRTIVANSGNNQFQIFVTINGLSGVPASGELEIGFVGLWGVS